MKKFNSVFLVQQVLNETLKDVKYENIIDSN